MLFFLLANEWHNEGTIPFMRVPLSPPRATDNLIEKCPYTSGGRNAGVSGKRGLLYLESYDALNFDT